MNFQHLLAVLASNLTAQKALEKLASMAQWLCGYGAGHVVATSGELKTLDSLRPGMAAGRKLVVVDGGANIGDFSDYVLKALPGSALELHLFEPLPDLAADLRERYKNLPQVKVNQLALSDAIGEATIFTKAGSSAISSMAAAAHGRLGVDLSDEVGIATTTLDAYCSAAGITRVDFLKLDIEGYEVPALRGAKGLMEQGVIRRILFEFGDACLESRYFFRDVFYLLTKAGFTVARITPTGFLRPLEGYSEKLENFRVTNYFAWKDEAPPQRHP